MTIETTSVSIDHVGTGVDGNFPYDFKIKVASDLVVKLDDIVQSSGYTVNGAGDAAGGSVDFDVDPALDVAISFRRNVRPLTQASGLVAFGGNRLQRIEDILDRSVMAMQEYEADAEALHDALPADNPHSVTLTQAVTADAGTDILAAELEALTDNSNVDDFHIHSHDKLTGLADDDHTQYLTEARHDALDHTGYLTEARHDALAADNPHAVTLTQALAADGATSASTANIETLTDGSSADALHVHTANTEIQLPARISTVSGTAHEFTGIPAGTTEIVISLSGVSTSGTSPLLIQLGTASYLATNYVGGVSSVNGATSASATVTTGFQLEVASVDGVALTGQLRLSLYDDTNHYWSASGVFHQIGNAIMSVAGSHEILGAALAKIQLTTVGGSDTFDNGNFAIKYIIGA